ncbi:uncharacterized protein J4E84_009931 [Alternaria hordeiaustralica]|uniref:uncharacterized protein n=1 Tax=Alternaria hordeiaustralica TaxID=1187925 RepID=UPI0020C597A0|nr:uncharacterized protein J4E84_009931 [Alternaria hordeiaustralica]KAI4675955.1 hypothetical protein J4E84_009931 [Alternaria hordeiaustralica]
MNDTKPMSSPDHEAASPKSSDEEQQGPVRPVTRTNASSFAAPTRASEAKKNEKIELAQYGKRSASTRETSSRPGSAMRQRSSPGFVSRPQSRQRLGAGTPTRGGDDDEVDDVDDYVDIDEEDADDDEADDEVHDEDEARVDDDDSSQFDSDVEDEKSAEEEEEEAASILGEKGLEGKPLEKEDLEEDKLQEEMLEKQAHEQVSEPQEELTIQEQGQPYDLEDLLVQEEPQEHHDEDPSPDVQASQERESPLTQDDTAAVSQEDHGKKVESQAAAPQDQIESVSPHGNVEKPIVPPEIVAEIQELQIKRQKVEEERDEAMRQRETVLQELQTVKEEATNLKQEYEKLSVQLRESEAKIAARNAREPGLPPLEEVEAENKKLRASIERTRLELQAKKTEAEDATAACKSFDDSLREVDEKLKNNQESIRTLCEVVNQVAENLPMISKCETKELDAVFLSLSQDDETGKLRGEFLRLIKNFNGDFKELREQIEDLKREVAEKEYEINSLGKTIEIERKGLLSPGLPSPHPMQTGKNEWEQYYEREKKKRRDADLELAKAKKLLSQLQPENERLQSNLTEAQEELAELRPKNDQLEMEAKTWKEELEENKAQFEQHSLALEANISEQQLENFRYIRDYYQKVKDQAHWEVQGLQQKLSVADQVKEALKRDYKREQGVNTRLEDAVIRLRKSVKARDIHIGKTEQAFMREAPFPIRSPSTSGSRTPDSDTSSSTSPSSISDWTHPLERVKRPPLIPRCHLPAAIQAREARLKTYTKELEEAREVEIFKASVKPRGSTARGGTIATDIMDQVRKSGMGSLYPVEKTGWLDTSWKGAWERWDGNYWAMEFAKGKQVDFLKKVGVWREDWN